MRNMQSSSPTQDTLKEPALQESCLVPVTSVDIQPTLQKVYLSQTQVLSIGRQEGCGLIVNHKTISRRHAEISYANGQYVLRDLGSKNGSRVNERRITPNSLIVLKPESKVQFGDVAFLFQTQQVDPSGSILLNKQQKLALFAPPRAKDVGEQEREADITRISEAINSGVQGQPALSHDGSLIFPGATSPLPFEAVSTLRQGPVLVVLLRGKPTLFPLSAQKHVTIGRDAQNDITLSEMSISRKHAYIFPGPDGLYIRDLQSGNGIRVNHSHITSACRLTHEAHIAFGNISAYFMHYQQPLFPVPPSMPNGVVPVVRVSSQKRDSETMPAAVALVSAPRQANCRQCGEQLVMHAKFCPRCGAQQ
ncbi:FHA domain-containing protein [Ktedonospora formicarum]|uniref:FHA domain-containing protein n=1 Tax=Ktedonospora formicarum TaxID=2778364 RepID=A0A8J3MQF2_9CHLR|nr:FHA domain-containing protein [Ktedonospora formicarum]GHO42701.1 hypothetical protein KSX_08640 [Ktedonospora formicarum]